MPSSVRTTLSGLRSRCRTPSRCALARPAATPAGDVEGTLEVERFRVQEVAQGLATHELHDDERHPVLFTDVVDRGDVGMVEGRGQQRLLPEALATLGISRHLRWQDLDGDLAMKLRVGSAVD